MTIALSLLMSHTAHLKIAIIGGAGLVGTALSQAALDQGHTILALDRPPSGRVAPQAGYEYRQLDALDYHVVKETLRGCDALVHLAAVYNDHDDEGHILDDSFTQNVSVIVFSRRVRFGGDPDEEEWLPLFAGKELASGRSRRLANTTDDQQVHNINTAMSYNALCACAELGINRVVVASSVNAIGLSELLA